MTNQLILAIGINSTDSEKKKIQKRLKLENIDLHIASIKDILFTIIDGDINLQINNKDLKKYDYIWIQSGWKTTHMAYLLHIYLNNLEIQHNKTNTHNTKLSDLFFLALNKIAVPNTFFKNGQMVDDTDIQLIEDNCDLPCIYKTYLGSKGSRVHLIEDGDNIKETIKEKGRYNRYIFQEYIPNDFDYRVVIVNGEASSISKRTRVGDEYRNNVALGADEQFLDISETPEDVLDIAIKSAKALNLKWAGVDIVTDKNTGKNYILEVNRRPELTEKSVEILSACDFISQLVD
jgi:glutathione synthase/RimK-type ligase-like ATP-grasp enzyme